MSSSYAALLARPAALGLRPPCQSSFTWSFVWYIHFFFHLIFVLVAASVDRIISSSNTVNEGKFFNVTCQASGNPSPRNYTWINKDGQLFSGSVLNFINISRAEAGQYRCVVGNRCGKDGRNTSVNVYCK